MSPAQQQHTEGRRRARITRRGRLVLTTCGTLLIALTILLIALPDDEGKRPPERTGQLTVPEGRRAKQVFAAADKALNLAEGTTAKAARTAKLPLPPEARGNPEGYLYPATYPIEKGTGPKTLLSFMVSIARQKFTADGLTDGTGTGPGGLSAYETVIVASIVQAEADTPQDMGKVARVIHNRIAKGMPLQMDSTLNYALDRSTLTTSHADLRTATPYNTYRHKGLPPTPIGNPGRDAMRAAVAPPKGNWLYFVTVKPGDTRFTKSYAEQRRNVEEFNKNQDGEGEGQR